MGFWPKVSPTFEVSKQRVCRRYSRKSTPLHRVRYAWCRAVTIVFHCAQLSRTSHTDTPPRKRIVKSVFSSSMLRVFLLKTSTRSSTEANENSTMTRSCLTGINHHFLPRSEYRTRMWVDNEINWTENILILIYLLKIRQTFTPTTSLKITDGRKMSDPTILLNL